MKLARLLCIVVLLAAPVHGQFTAQNPLDELKDQVTKVLADAKVPFTSEQDRQLALLIEEQRQASEDLFGVIMDFKDGPPQGEERDRALAGIQWMHDEFKKKLPEFLTAEQRAAWEKFEAGGTTLGARIEGAGVGGARREQVQQIRIVNNAFNAETATSGPRGPNGGGDRTEVIQRGGAGAFHGNFSAMFQDESLNARNPFASNKPPYYERTINGNFSGPLIQDRLTANFIVDDSRAENVGTVKAETLNGPFSLGITRPTIDRSYEGRGILQLSEPHSLHFGFKYTLNSRKNLNIGNFVLPERGSNSDSKSYIFDLREISVLSEKTVHEIRFGWRQDRSLTKPITSGIAINVLDAFNGGGGQSYNKLDATIYEFRNLLYRADEKLIFRGGFSGTYRTEQSIIEDNTIGEFTFSDLASYRAGTPLQYRVTRGNPLTDLNQLQVAFFVQNDLRITNRFTLFLGLRYEDQNNVSDHNNIDPRIGLAYAIGSSTVIRGGAGLFHTRLNVDTFRTLARLDGTRQYEIQIDRPGWPDPFVSGNVRTVPPASRRVQSPTLANQYYSSAALSLEQSFPNNLFVSIGGDFSRGSHLPRGRNLNAPLPGTGEKPFPNEGNIFMMQSSGLGTHKNFKLSMRQRFSIFSVTASYALSSSNNDEGIGGNAGTQGQGFEIPANSHDLKAEWGPSGLTQKHTFTTAVNSRLPLDVYLTTNITARSGSVYNTTTGKDDNRDGVANDRPAGVPKNDKTGPSFFNVSFNFSKAFRLSRSAVPSGANGRGDAAAGPQMNVFANLNNAFNMTHLGTPSGVMTSPFYGKSFNATAPREIEIGMRFQF